MAKFEASSKRRVTLRSNNDVPLLMGIVNATPDSFYAGSRHGSIELGMDFLTKERLGLMSAENQLVRVQTPYPSKKK